MTQEQVIEIALSGKNVFLTGKAGTGKTYTLNKIIELLKEKGKHIGKTASTGIAATHINGTTIHSFAGLGIKDELKDDDLFKAVNDRRRKAQVENLSTLIIDEISMLPDFKLDQVNTVLKRMLDKSKPFGGVQIILVGDFFQLPPVTNNNNKKNYAFNAGSWLEGKFVTCYLDKIYRQKDADFIDLLNNIRTNSVTKEQEQMLSDLQKNRVHEHEGINLYFKNVDVDRENDIFLDKIDSPDRFWKMKCDGNPYDVEKITNRWTGQENLRVKEGARVMFLSNNFNRGYVNGSMGEVVGFGKDPLHKVFPDNVYPIVKLINGPTIVASPNEWAVEEDDENGITVKKASVWQVPLRLAYAITIHKSQGSSFDYANSDLSNIRDRNMGYVALSRVRSLDGLWLKGFNWISLRTDPVIVEQDKHWQRESIENEKTFTDLSI